MKRVDWSVGQRLAAGSILIVILLAILGAVLFSSVSRVADLRREKVELIAPRARLAASLEVAVYQQAVAFRNYALTRAPQDLEAFRRSLQQVEHRLEAVGAMLQSPEGRALFEEVRRLVADHQESFDGVLDLLRAGATPEVVRQGEAEVASHRNAVINKVREFASLQALRSEQADREIDRAVDNVRRVVTVVIVLLLIASAATSWFVARAVRLPARRLTAAAVAMREGSFEAAKALEESDEAVERAGQGGFRDELREASHLFGRMAATLEKREKRLAAQSRLSATLGSSLDPEHLAASALREMTDHIGAQVGAVYLTDAAATTLRPLATQAVAMLTELPVGAGIPGQAAREHRTILVRDIPPDSPFEIRLGIDAVPPRNVAASPMMIKDRLLGVVVIAGLAEMDADAIRFLDSTTGQLAITLDNALAHAQIAALAEELQSSNETLEAQNEELQAQSEELQAQSEELQSQNEELQVQSEELQEQSQELLAQQESLSRTNDALLTAETQKNHFLAVLGHELRNPLAAIHGAISLLQKESTRREAEEMIRRQSRHLGRLLDDLLDVGRITSGKIQLDRGAFDLAEAVRRCVGALPANGAKPLILTEVREPVWVDADETRVEQIITNLLTNAIRHTPSDGTITIRLARDAGGAVLSVSDTGAGIEPELLPRLFELFTQGEGAKAKGGLGVGLALVRSLVELHGGTVEAASPGRGKGATVTVHLPALAGPPVFPPAPVAEPVLPVKRSIVVIDDNPDVRKVLQLMLKNSGHDVAEAFDGPTGVETVTLVRPDVALIDLDLPGFDGCEVARRVRQDPTLAGVRLIAVSGYGRPEDRARALGAGFDEHLVKPVDMARLQASVLG